MRAMLPPPEPIVLTSTIGVRTTKPPTSPSDRIKGLRLLIRAISAEVPPTSIVMRSPPLPVVLTFSPCGSPRTLALLKWLGIAVPRWLENELLDARDTLETSVRLAEAVADDVLAFAHERQIPVGVNVESVSIRKEEIDAATALFTGLRARLGR